MHELLTAATGWPTPLTWQCMNATAFQLLPAPPAQSGVARPMDGLEISPLSPQEDEFALLSLGVDSAYRGFLMPERLPELLHTLDPAYWQRHAATWLPRFKQDNRSYVTIAIGCTGGQHRSVYLTERLAASFPDEQVLIRHRQLGGRQGDH